MWERAVHDGGLKSTVLLLVIKSNVYVRRGPKVSMAAEERAGRTFLLTRRQKLRHDIGTRLLHTSPSNWLIISIVKVYVRQSAGLVGNSTYFAAVETVADNCAYAVKVRDTGAIYRISNYRTPTGNGMPNLLNSTTMFISMSCTATCASDNEGLGIPVGNAYNADPFIFWYVNSLANRKNK